MNCHKFALTDWRLLLAQVGVKQGRNAPIKFALTLSSAMLIYRSLAATINALRLALVARFFPLRTRFTLSMDADGPAAPSAMMA